MSRRRRLPRILFVAGIDLLVLLLLFAVGEIAVRWYREGGFVPALASLADRRAVPADPGSRDALVPDPVLGFRLNPEAPGMNALGLRHGEIERPKPDSVFRILVVGDSVSWFRDGWVDRLRDELGARGTRNGRAVEVLNAAVPGYTTYQERLFLQEILAPVDPDVVVLQYCLNDNHRFLVQLTPEGGWLMTQEGRRALFPEGEGPLARFARWSYLLFEIRKRLLAGGGRLEGPHAWDRDLHFRPAWQESSWEDERASLLAIRDLARSTGAAMLLVAVPWEPQLDPEVLAAERETALAPQRRLAAIGEQAGIPFLDLAPVFEAATGTDLYVDGIHLTPEGHAIAAREVAAALEREGMLP